jgi:hypothetical protein
MTYALTIIQECSTILLIDEDTFVERRRRFFVPNCQYPICSCHYIPFHRRPDTGTRRCFGIGAMYDVLHILLLESNNIASMTPSSNVENDIRQQEHRRLRIHSTTSSPGIHSTSWNQHHHQTIHLVLAVIEEGIELFVEHHVEAAPHIFPSPIYYD